MGTGAQVSVWTEEPVEARGWEVRPYPGIEGGYLLVGVSLGGGKSYALLANFYHRCCSLFAGTEPVDLYERMERAGSRAVGDELSARPGLRVIPNFYGARQKPLARGAILDLTEHNFTPEAFIAGLLDGISTELQEFISALPASVRGRLTRAVGTGNGVRRNENLCESIRRHLELPFQVTPYEEEAAVGAALWAASKARQL